MNVYIILTNYNNIIYKQIFGVAIGSPIALALAELVIPKYVYDNINFNHLFLYTYVDDFFCILPNNEIELTLQLFNSYHNRLNFTIEKENNKSLAFLDTTIYGESSHLYTKWHSKNYASNRFLNFHSNCKFQ